MYTNQFYQAKYSSSKDNNWNQGTGFQQNLIMEKQKQKQAIKQAMIVDQNYANDIFMMVFSTLETLAARQQNLNLSKHDKIYGYYDRTDYSQKNLKELISQLQIHLLNFQTSKKIFEKNHGPNSYTLPSSFTKTDFDTQIDQFKKVFRYNEEIKQMVQDFSNIMAQTNASTTYWKKDYDVEYSEKEKKLHRKNMVNTSMKAGNIMREQKEKVLRGNYHTSSQLPVQINYNNRGKSSINGVSKRNY